MTLAIGSLFSGIGGLELGLERAGLGPVIWQAEIEPFARTVLARHWPDARRFENVKEVDEHAERPDIICGGFPCQDISLAGRRAGIEGTRSGLWAEYARILGALRPEWVVVENTASLANRGLDRVLGDLAALRYDAVWDCIPAAAVGAPHRRDRIFIVAKLADATCKRREAKLPGGATHAKEHDSRTLPRDSGHVGADDGCDLPQWPPSPGDMHSWGQVQAGAQPAVCKLADGLSHVMDSRRERLKALGNAVVPQVAEVIGRAIVAQQQRLT